MVAADVTTCVCRKMSHIRILGGGRAGKRSATLILDEFFIQVFNDLIVPKGFASSVEITLYFRTCNTIRQVTDMRNIIIAKT
jgi:hypothetical protein